MARHKIKIIEKRMHMLCNIHIDLFIFFVILELSRFVKCLWAPDIYNQ